MIRRKFVVFLIKFAKKSINVFIKLYGLAILAKTLPIKLNDLSVSFFAYSLASSL